MINLCRSIVAALLVLGASSTASAQEFIYALVQTGEWATARTTLFEVPTTGGQIGAPIPVAGVPGRLAEGPEVTAGGQLVAWSVRPASADPQAPPALAVFDRQSRTVAVLGTIARLGLPDPSRLRLFATIGDLLHAITPAGAAPLAGTEGLTVVKVSADGQRLYALRGEFSSERSIEIRDSATGGLLRSISLPSDARLPAVTDDEASLYIVTGDQNAGILRKLDAATGAELASIALPPPPSSITTVSVLGIVTDDARQRVAASLSYFAGGPFPASSELWTLDATTLQEVARVSTGGTPQLRLDARAGRLFMISSRFFSRPVPTCEAALQTASVTTGQIETSFPTGTTACIPFALALPPAAPVQAEAVVSGASVTLSWTASGLTTGFVIEAGSAAGLADIATLTVPSGTTLTVPNVAAGTYFVRIRALNYVGSSEASNEMQVNVP